MPARLTHTMRAPPTRRRSTMDNALTETEQLLIHAQEIAARRFTSPSERAVMDIFDELRAERDRTTWALDDREAATLH
ncbi:hypothetical protein G6F57_023184 [Rhizopus arrhizus]|nr:hypothetical protein G6F57_023184 [Rhizopus arrhizus]